jgi:hypothetical protein
MSATACTASRYGDHDYSEPPHNTPDNPRDAEDETTCQHQGSQPPFGPCEHERRYEIIIYQPGSHDWIRLLACVPCTASLRMHARIGPGGLNDQPIARIRDYRETPAGRGA